MIVMIKMVCKLPAVLAAAFLLAVFQLPSQAQYFPGFGGGNSSQQQGGGRCRGYDGPGGPCYAGPGGSLYNGPGGPCYDGPGGPCYSGPGGSGRGCSPSCP